MGSNPKAKKMFENGFFQIEVFDSSESEASSSSDENGQTLYIEPEQDEKVLFVQQYDQSAMV
jgi:hypothetical protein